MKNTHIRLAIIIALSFGLLSFDTPELKFEKLALKMRHCRMNNSEILDQCSRYSPDFETVFKPKSYEVKQCFSKMFEERRYLESKLRYPIEEYQAQIVGFTKDEKRYLYLNCMKKGFMSFRFFMRKPLVVCDGGPNFWGLVYCIDTNTIEGISFNGFL